MVWGVKCDVKGEFLPALFHDAERQTQHFIGTGRKYRVTVEEEFNGCCEKWRHEIITPPSKPGWAWDGFMPLYCPECGRKLY